MTINTTSSLMDEIWREMYVIKKKTLTLNLT